MLKNKLLLLGFVSGIFWSFIPDLPMQTSWELIKKESGVHFYETHRDSRVNGKVHSVIKIENKNSYPVKVTFTPDIRCDGQEQDESALSCALETNDSYQQQYKCCDQGAEVSVSITKISIEKM